MKLVEQLDNGQFRETNFNAPAQETDRARLEQLGPFRRDNLAQGLVATAMTLGAVDAVAPVDFVAGAPGSIVGIAFRVNEDVTAGTGTAQATIAGTVVGETAVLSDTVQQKITNFATPVKFAAGALLGVKVLTDGSWAPATADGQAYLLIRWDPS